MSYILINRFSSEYINSLPVVRFNGKVVVVQSRGQEEEAVKLLRQERYVGFDTESKPAFKKGESYPISLVQLATKDTAYLLQLKKTKFSNALADFLSNNEIKKIGIGVNNDIVKLQELKEFTAGGFIDLSTLAAERGIIQIGARGLTARYIARRLVKSSQKTNWAQPDLTRKQQIYAASDAWICLKIYPRLLADAIDYSQFIDDDDEQHQHRSNPSIAAAS
ncbi:MAG: 3'-5' exonuclease domain-containing protein 2 [Candidatus Aminicenantes bacterium]|nr:3'-5' exonuclease domain-containing protein 2 [Candidatus Aminicenantes bacterium]